MQLMTVTWSVLLLRGILSIIFAAILFFYPGLSIELLILFFSVYVLFMGVNAVFAAFRERSLRSDWWLQLIEGIFGIIVALAVWFWPGISALMLIYVIATWAIVTGLVQLFSAIRLHKVIKNDFWLGLSGIISILFGVYVIAYPGAGAVALVWLIGIYALLFGIFFIAAALRLRALQQRNQ